MKIEDFVADYDVEDYDNNEEEEEKFLQGEHIKAIGVKATKKFTKKKDTPERITERVKTINK